MESNWDKKVILTISWTKPCRGWYKLNIDGAYNKEKGIEGIGGVIRNEKGDWLIGFASKISVKNPVQAELMALYEGLCIANNRKLYPLEIETDATQNYGAADDSSCRMEREDIVDKKFMFKVEVKSSNGKNQDDVLKVVTLSDDEEIIKKYILSPREEAFKDPDFNNNELSHEDNEIADYTEDNELIDVANTPAKIAAVVEEDSNAQLSGNKIKRVFKKRRRQHKLFSNVIVAETKICLIS